MDSEHKQRLMQDFVDRFVVVCAKCGRGFLGQSKDALIDSQPIWWTQEQEGKRCDGRIVRRDRMALIEELTTDKIMLPDDVYVLPAGGS